MWGLRAPLADVWDGAGLMFPEVNRESRNGALVTFVSVPTCQVKAF
jgi:hypothetical protein